MPILISILLVIEVVSAFLLVVVILAQKSKDQGLGMAFGSGMGESLFGSRAGNVLTRLTITLATVFMVTTMVLAVLFSRTGEWASAAPVAPAPTAAPAPMQAPMMPEEVPAPMVAPSEPITLQMDESGQLTPVEAPVNLEPQPAPAPAPEEPVADSAAPVVEAEAEPAGE